MKKQLKELKDSLRHREEELATLKKDIKFTRLDELRVVLVINEC